MSRRWNPWQSAVSWAVCGVFWLLGCLNPRPEELPSDRPTDDVPVVPASPPAPTDQGIVSQPGAEEETPDPSIAPPDASDAGDAGAPRDDADASGPVRTEDRGGVCQDAGE